MGTDPPAIHTKLTWLIGIDNKGKLLPATRLAILRIYWKHVYAAMVRVRYDGHVFVSLVVTQNIARSFYSRILAYQHTRLLHSFKRRFSHHGKYRLPQTEATRMAPNGTLRLMDGSLTVKQGIINLLQQQNISCDHFNAHSPTPPPSARRPGGSHNGNNGSNNNSSNSNCSNSNCSNSNDNNNNANTNPNGVRAGVSTELLFQFRQRGYHFQPNMANG
eukprot:5512486-Pleurochrysis_carterae.AAC.1